MNHQVVKSLTANFELLRNAICSSDFVYVTGLPSCGKTSLSRWVLEERKDFRFAYIDCNFISNTNSLYSAIIKELQIPSEGHTNGLEFMNLVKNYYNDMRSEGVIKIFVVLDQVELLKKTDAINGLLYLFYMDTISLMLVSCESPYDFLEVVKVPSAKAKFMDQMAMVTLLPWSENDLKSFVLKQQPAESKDLYKKFVHNVVSTVHMVNSRDPIELRSFCHEQFPTFLLNCKLKLFDHLLKIGDVQDTKDLNHLDLDDYKFSINPSMMLGTFLESYKESITKFEICDLGDSTINSKLTLHKNCLILASYVAAYTRSSDDKRNFVRFQKRVPKRMKRDPEENCSNKPFTMERLIHIYTSLIQLHTDTGSSGRDEIPDSVFGDIQLLEDLDLIRIVSGDGLDPSTRYRLSDFVNRKYVEELGQLIDLQINTISGLN